MLYNVHLAITLTNSEQPRVSLTLYLHYTTRCGVCQEVFENFFRLLASTTTVGLTFSNPRPRVLPLLTLLSIALRTPLVNSFRKNN